MGGLEKSIELPKEHGFWVMMPAALLAGAARAGFTLEATIAALLLGVFATAFGGAMHGRIRRLEWAQLLSSALLATLVAPVELVGELPLRTALYDTLAWASLFVVGSLVVRASFSRARRRSKAAPYYGAASLLVGVASCAYLLLHSACASAAVSGASIVLGLSMLILRPRPQQLKLVGITLAMIVLLSLGLQIALISRGY